MPSKTYSEKIAVSNTTKSAMSVSLYPAAATNIKDVFQPIDSTLGNDLTSWTTVTPKLLKIAPFSEEIATVTITVPSGAKSGMQYGIIWASISTFPNSNALGGVSRVGIRMYTPVGAGTSVATTTVNEKVSWLAGHVMEVEWSAISLLFIFVIIFGARAVRKERKRAKKRRRKNRD